MSADSALTNGWGRLIVVWPGTAATNSRLRAAYLGDTGRFAASPAESPHHQQLQRTIQQVHNMHSFHLFFKPCADNALLHL